MRTSQLLLYQSTVLHIYDNNVQHDSHIKVTHSGPASGSMMLKYVTEMLQAGRPVTQTLQADETCLSTK